MKRVFSLSSVTLPMMAVVIVMFVSNAWAGGVTEKVLHNFNGSSDGFSLYGGLIFDKAGNIYGTTQFGGAKSSGTVFELSPNADGTWSETVLYSFAGGTDGSEPSAALIVDAKGNLYGTTLVGGSAANAGTVFELTPSSGGSWTESVIHTFTGGTDGSEPTAGLVFDTKGHLFGTTAIGGSTDDGIVFELAHTPASGWIERVIHTFAGGKDGIEPNASLIFDAAGHLYGTTQKGGGNGSCFSNCGTVFRLTPESRKRWKEAILYAFKGNGDGASPIAGLVFDKKGNLYSTTRYGGTDNQGTVFKLTLGSRGGWRESVVYSFILAKDGSAGPVSNLIVNRAGSLFGTTLTGGGPAFGTVFKVTHLSSGWKETIIHIFTGTVTDGAYPSAGLVSDAAGHLYGATLNGGTANAGVVFEVTP